MLSSFRRTLTVVVAVVATFGLSACSDDSTGTSGGDLPTQRAQEITQKVTALSTTINQNTGFNGLNSITGAVPTSGIVQSGITLDASEIERMSQRDLPEVIGVAPSPAELNEILSSPDRNVIPDTEEGTFWEYDFTNDVWVKNSNRASEAPSNGIRFALYDSYSAGVPSSQTEVGFIDLEDESPQVSGNQLAVEVTDTSAGVTYVDYTLNVSGWNDGTPDTGSASAVGFISDGTTQVDFDISIDATDAGTDLVDITYDIQLDIPSQNLSMGVLLTGTTDTSTGEGSGTIEITVTDQGDTLKITLNIASDGTITGQATWNGAKFADAQGSESQGLTWVDPQTGDPLPQEEQNALNAIFGLVFLTGLTFLVVVFSVGGAAVFGV